MISKPTYTCRCGSLASYAADNLHHCPLCGTLINLHRLHLKQPTDREGIYADCNIYPNTILDMFDISSKYINEIKKINKLLSVYDGIVKKRIQVLIDTRDLDVDRSSCYYNSLNRELDSLTKQYNRECGKALISGDHNIVDLIIAQIRCLKSDIQQEKQKLDKIIEKHNRIITRVAAESKEGIIIAQLNSMREDYIERMSIDWDRYGDYLACIYLVDYREDVSYCDKLIELSKDISDEDDEYLKSICDTYEGKDHYVSRAKRIKHAWNCKKTVYKKSRARNIKVSNKSFLDTYPMMDIDPWGVEAARSCFESYVRNIADNDESIGGIKL